jgi:hypothetical protein
MGKIRPLVPRAPRDVPALRLHLSSLAEAYEPDAHHQMRFIRFVPGDRPNSDARETIPGADYLGVLADEPPSTPKRRVTMNASQVASMVTTLFGLVAGYAIAHGFSPDQWTAVAGGAGALAAWAVDYFWNKNRN